MAQVVAGPLLCQRLSQRLSQRGVACAQQVVALVGPSGGGKSSIVKLVQRFYLPTSGAVLLDGADVGAFEPRWLRRHVALVAQVRASQHCAPSLTTLLCSGWSPPKQAQVGRTSFLLCAGREWLIKLF